MSDVTAGEGALALLSADAARRCDGVDCQCGDRVFVLRLSPYQWRRLTWRNLSPVVRRLRGGGGVVFAQHADGRFTLEESP